mgnify:CR=1 FL=1
MGIKEALQLRSRSFGKPLRDKERSYMIRCEQCRLFGNVGRRFPDGWIRCGTSQLPEAPQGIAAWCPQCKEAIVQLTVISHQERADAARYLH